MAAAQHPSWEPGLEVLNTLLILVCWPNMIDGQLHHSTTIDVSRGMKVVGGGSPRQSLISSQQPPRASPGPNHVMD